MHTLQRSIALAFVTLMVVPAALAAQQPRPAAGTPAKKGALKVEPWLSAEAEYDNNIFLLSSGRKRAVDDPSAADVASGRFADMESSDDIVAQFGGGIGVTASGLAGRDLTFSPALRYDYYTKNSERSHMTASVAIAQALARGMRTKLEASYTPSYFPKNYLVDAVDANNDRVIAPAERRYAAADYSAMDVELAHRLRLRKSTKLSPLQLELDLGAGYYSRSYDAPFASRDLSGPTFRSALGFAPGRRADFTLQYELEMLSADEGQEILILDEAAAGRDLNANGTATDLNVRTAQMVDRSRREHELSGEARLDVARRTDLRVRYGLRLRNYSSDQPLDIGHRDRKDTRHELRGEIATRIARGLRFTAGARYARQTTNRLSFDSDEADDYTRARGFAGLRLEF